MHREVRRALPTIKDVAAFAGVSLGTASNVLNEKPGVKPALRERVLAAARELGYVPNINARNIRSRLTQTIGVLVPYLTNPFFAMAVESVEQVLHQRGYLTITGCTGSDPELRQSYLAALLGRRIDGLLVFPSSELAAALSSLARRGMPIVFIERELPPTLISGSFDAVVIDNAEGVRIATQHLAETGHKRIGLVSLRASSLSGEPRLLGYRTALMECQLDEDPSLIALGPGTAEVGYQLANRLLSLTARPTGVVVASNMQGIGVLDALQASELQIPRDVSVVLYSTPGSSTAASSSMLSTVVHQADELGKRAAELLLARINEPDAPARREVITPRLELRASTAPPKGGVTGGSVTAIGQVVQATGNHGKYETGG